jgi:hypothetical protein
MSENIIISEPQQQQQQQQERKIRVIIGLIGYQFSQAFLLSWTKALHNLIESNRYEIIISPGKSYFVPYARMHTLGLNVLRGKDQKPFNGQPFDVYVSIDSDVIFSPYQLIELIETTSLHPVVSGYYMMSNNKHFDVVKDWDTDYFSKTSTFKFLTPKDTEEDMIAFAKEVKEINETQEKEKKFISIPNFMKVSYAGMGFFACRKEVLDKLKYPYSYRELQHIQGENGVEIVDMCSEDVAFCKNIKDAGYDIMLNTRLRVGHENHVIL